MGLRIIELLSICEALNLTPPPRATVADLEMMIKHWAASKGANQLVPYTGPAMMYPPMPGPSAAAPSWVMQRRAAVGAGALPVATAAPAAGGPGPGTLPAPFKDPVKLQLTWKTLDSQSAPFTCMDTDTVIAHLMTLSEHDVVKFNAPEEIRSVCNGRS